MLCAPSGRRGLAEPVEDLHDQGELFLEVRIELVGVAYGEEPLRQRPLTSSDPAIGPMAGWPVHTSVENSREIIRDVLSANETYAVCLKKDGRPIGSIGLIPPTQANTAAKATEMKVGFWVGVPHWGKGYIPEALREIQLHAFEDLDRTALWCGYYDGNDMSARVQQKCGFAHHHTVENVDCPLVNDTRTEHFTYLSRARWELLRELNDGPFIVDDQETPRVEAL